MLVAQDVDSVIHTQDDWLYEEAKREVALELPLLEPFVVT